MTTKTPPTAEEQARKRAKYLSGLLWHVGTFVIINVFFWLLDLVTGVAGVQWAFWVTLVWGLALAFHARAYSSWSAARYSRVLRASSWRPSTR